LTGISEPVDQLADAIAELLDNAPHCRARLFDGIVQPRRRDDMRICLAICAQQADDTAQMVGVRRVIVRAALTAVLLGSEALGFAHDLHAH
jgi:hypothetical protein